MPCYDPRGNEPRVVYREGVEYRDKIVKVENPVNPQLKERNDFLEGAVCAIVKELSVP